MTPLRIFALITLAGGASAQETRGSIAGRVTDPRAAAVVDCSVTVTNKDTGVALRFTSNSAGYYEANLLLPGSYEISASAPGFKQFVRRGVALPVGSRVEIDIPLELGEVTQTVTVTTDAPLLDTATAQSGRVVDNRSLSDLPILNNMSLLLANLTPGVQTAGVNSWVSYHSGGGGLTYSNGSVGRNDFAIDGVPNNSGGGAAFIPHTESVEEFKMETSGFDASMGHSAGLNVAMMTKAGTNRVYGSLTETYWNQRWQASSFFVRQKHYTDIAAARAKGDNALADRIAASPMLMPGFEHNYASTIGGPVAIPKLFNGRNRLFFFFSYNGFVDSRAEEANVLNRTVPGLAERNGDFSGLLQADATRYQIHDPLSVRPDPARPSHVVRSPFAGNLIPQSRVINPMYKAYASFYPKPNNTPASPRTEPTNNYLASNMVWDLGYNAISNRFDYQVSEKHRLFTRWNWFHYTEERSDWTYETTPGLTVNAQRRWGRGVSFDYNYTLSPRTMLDFSAGSTERRAYFEPLVVMSYKPSDVGFPKYLDDRAGAFHTLPVLSVSGYNGMSQGYPANERNRLLTGKVDLFHNRGTHTLRAGFDARGQMRTRFDGGAMSGTFGFDNQFTRREDDSITPAGSLGHSWAAFMMGTPSSMSIALIDSYASLNPYYAWYAQDNWRLTPRLSLTLGLRMEYELGGTERFNRAIGSYDATLTLPITAGAQAAYARSPQPELAASAFAVKGGSWYPGVEGRGRQLWQNEMLFLPRLAAAYQLRKDIVLRGGYGIFFDSNNVHNLTPDMTGFSRSTSTIVTTNFGQTWLAGDPARGISPVADPFPVRANGTRFDQPTRTALGSMAKAGRGWTYLDFGLRHPRQQRWRFGAQKQLGGNDMVEVSYAGFRADRIAITQPLSPLAEPYWADGLVRNNTIATNLSSNVTNPFLLAHFAELASSNPVVYQDMSTNSFFTSATTPKQRLLRAHPQIGGLNRTTNVGASRMHSLEVSYNRRFARGVSLQAAYTRTSTKDQDYYYNEFDPAPSWRPSNNSRPHRFTTMGVWELPFGKGRRFLKQGALSYILGGWQTSATYEFQPGALLEWGNLFFYGNLADIGTGTRAFDRWFNTANFERTSTRTPAAYHRRVFPQRIDGLRADRTNHMNTNVQREFRYRERLRLLLRLDALNVLNRSQMNAPDLSPTSSNFGRITSQSAAQNRFIQIQARIRF